MEKSVIDFILKKDCGMYECIEQKEQLEKIIDLHLSQECESSEIFFKEGVKVGMRFAAECLID